jgi:predicted nucleic acid-binding protein
MARLRACHAGLEITGTLGVLLRLHRLGLASRDLEEDLRLLEETDMRISPKLRRAVIHAGDGTRIGNPDASSQWSRI